MHEEQLQYLILLGYADKGADEMTERFHSEKIVLENSKKNEESPDAIFQKFLEDSVLHAMTTSQFRKVLSSVDPPLPSERIEHLVKQVDKKGDGAVDIDEFSKLWRSNQLIPAK